MRRNGQERRNAAANAFFARACRMLMRLAHDEAGVTAIEYALLASLIAVVAAAGIATLGEGVGEMWTEVSDAVAAAM